METRDIETACAAPSAALPPTDTDGEQPATSVWCVLPVHDNAGTVKAVAGGCRAHVANVLVVDDGSTDADLQQLLRGTGVEVLRHDRNRGKGAAILTAVEYVKRHGGTHMITIDADGQHDPDDVPRFLEAIARDPNAIVVGCRDFSSPTVPRSSHFGRSFSNFWLRIETGLSLPDTQSGFRAYPVQHLARLHLAGRRYDFEVEVLTRAAWAGLPLESVDARVYYPANKAERTSSFRAFWDNLRISRIHTRLVLRRLLPWPHRRLVRKRPARRFILHPRVFLARLMREHATPGGLAAAAAVGVFLGALPLISCHMLVVLFVTSRLNLNKVMALGTQNLCMPPFVPLACIELGYFMRHGAWLTEATRKTIVYEAPERLLEWLLGSLVLAPILAALTAAVVYALATLNSRTGQKA